MSALSTRTHQPILVVEDDAILAASIRELLTELDYDVTSVATGRAAERALREHPAAVVLLDIGLPDCNGLDLFETIREIAPRTRVVFMTAHNSLDVVLGATSAGAYDFITKGDDLIHRIGVTVRNALDSLAKDEQVSQLVSSLHHPARSIKLISQSALMDEVIQSIEKVAQSRVNVLITGQSGTGKEIVARSIHESGVRHSHPFVAVNCAGIPDTLLESELFGYERGAFTGANARKIGKFEAAQGGTLFLDEVGEMSLPLQAKLLRVLQDGRYERLGSNQVVQADARILTATNRDLAAMVRQGTFREDLYYRIAVFSIHLPPLVARKGDIPLLVGHFVKAAAVDENKVIQGVTPEVMNLFELHPWPGNVRQLQNVVARAAVVCGSDRIALRDLPDGFVHELQRLKHQESTRQGDARYTDSASYGRNSPERLDESPTYGGGAQQRSADSMAALQLPPQTILQRMRTGTVAERLDYALSLAFPDSEQLPRIEDLELAGIHLAMHRLSDNLKATAERLEIGRATLYRRLNLAKTPRGPTPSTEVPALYFSNDPK